VLHGFLNIAKPTDCTSHDVVNAVRRLLGQRRVGHAGTLDPQACGVLVVGVGHGTRLIEYLSVTRKTYQAGILLGSATTTDDSAGEPVKERPVDVGELDVRAALDRFTGTISQVPPAFAAVHVDGTRAYVRARRGETLELEPRTVTIHRLDVLDMQIPHITVEVECSTGTYIRALARDVGEALGCGAHLESLTRTGVGSFALQDAVPLAGLADRVAESDWESVLLPLDLPLQNWPARTLDAHETARILNGMRISADNIAHPGQLGRAYDPQKNLVAVLQAVESDTLLWQPVKVFRYNP
jgi:tRNA pseudouridine55 synthase